VPHTSHADQLVKICRDVFKQGDAFVQKITGNPNVDRPLQRTREFRNRPQPKVVVTVDMLSTGVDIPALEFIVFLRPVKSRILWEQMLGRGTRRCADTVGDPDRGERYDVILTNPPFGTKGAGQAPGRDDFTIETSKCLRTATTAQLRPARHDHAQAGRTRRDGAAGQLPL
jgi:superfamily II DNA or RNA helicase